ncbi:hypothetical protein FACS1894106_4740 [Spirochaetia bacterium]|nr:hypothetical protein FACS1894106_4740 [Spirochaetia bacterium]
MNRDISLNRTFMKNEGRKFFLVCCKFGHVGRQYYLPMVVPVFAKNAAAAAEIARRHPGVKHNHLDAVLSVQIATRMEYLEVKDAFYKDPYWKGAKRQGGLFIDRLVPEQNYLNAYDEDELSRKASGTFHQRKYSAIVDEIRREIINQYGIAV